MTVQQLTDCACLHCVQGLLTNDVTSLQPSGAAPCYAALLNAQGRFLHDMVLSRCTGQHNG